MSAEEHRALAAAFDPNRLDPAFYENPYPVYAALRAFDPVHRCPDGTYFLSRYADLDRIYRDEETWRFRPPANCRDSEARAPVPVNIAHVRLVSADPVRCRTGEDVSGCVDRLIDRARRLIP